MLLREVQIFCKMRGAVGLHTGCFSWRGCYSESDPYFPLSSPASPNRCTAHMSSWNKRYVQRESVYFA